MNRNAKKQLWGSTFYEQLWGSTFYEQTYDSNLQKQNSTLKNEIINLKTKSYFSEKDYKFLSKQFHSSRIQIFHSSSKFPPLRPIVSGFNCISANLSEYVDSFLKYYTKTCKSYIRDTSDFLLKLKSLPKGPSTSMLATMGVNKGMFNQTLWRVAFSSFWNLTFPGFVILFIYKKGTVMGTPMAGNYASLFMVMFETSFLNSVHEKLESNPNMFHRWRIFYLDRRWRLVEWIFRILLEIQ